MQESQIIILDKLNFNDSLLEADHIDDRLLDILKQGHSCTGNLLGIPKNKEKAAYFFEQVEQYADAWLQCSIALLYEDGAWIHDYNFAEKWYKLAANKGLTRAQRRLSALYRSGNLGYQNEDEAQKWTLTANSPGKKLPDSPPATPEPLPSRGFLQTIIDWMYPSKGMEQLFGIQSENVPRVRALYNWQANRDDRLSIREGDILFLLYKDGDWWHCENQITREEGKVPRNFVVELSLDSPSNFDISSMDLPGNAVKINLNLTFRSTKMYNF